MYFSEHNSEEFTLVEEFFFLVDAPESSELQPIHLIAQIDLTEFRFTESELQKLRRLARKLEFALSDEFSRQWAAASVVVEVRARQSGR
jgi:nicotinic acid phosphoribosyltransferase